MQDFLMLSAIVSWVAIIFNLLLSFALLRRLRDVQTNNNANFQVPEVLEVGTNAPDFSLETLDGKTANLTDYKNQESLMVFVSPSCNPCRAQMPSLKELFPRIEAAGIRFLLVSLGAKEETQAFIEEFQMPNTVLLTDYGSSFVMNYKVSGTPSFYQIDKKGQIKAGGFLDQKWQDFIKQWAS